MSTASSYNLIGMGGSGGLTSINSTGNLPGSRQRQRGPGPGAGCQRRPHGDHRSWPAEPCVIIRRKANISGVTVPTVDQRGLPRLGGSNDICAFQLDATPTSVYVNSAGLAFRQVHRSISPETQSTSTTSAMTPLPPSRAA